MTTSKYKKLEVQANALQTEQQKLQAQAAQLTEENNKLKTDVEDLKTQQAALTQERDALKQQTAATSTKYDEVVGQLSEQVKAGQLQITQYKNMLTVDVAEKFFFDSGSATIKSSGKEPLKQVGAALSQYQDSSDSRRRPHRQRANREGQPVPQQLGALDGTRHFRGPLPPGPVRRPA